ncbi:MAG: flagellar biosynthetic protein FliR [Thermodesulfovibrio sp.]|uniref:flagellar biosynthetic protein FliR n=1 Tax=unclassified Thermodesulfovibrio TaxID=2645936 RepID=UPI00083A98B7|nr:MULTISPECIES: flagellar biosynthetic protein FliR [unclassified Thermodesulfovibrio]MDI1471810.1 flagellar biosynthetic protein FliR [Thermodesulfovibrio sp. 1176]MDI6713700.1 flagellar biosynthetic protein FliR [Thermodesulfovibrio sp.]ODA43327.1 Flagellar biosynthesis protein FliR [Thermodesulfovibrio sp. N1]
MEYLGLLTTQIYKFIPVFIRVSIILFFLPYIGSRTVPIMFRFFFALSVSLAIMPFVPQREEDFFISLLNAVVFGLAIGLMIRIIIAAVETASQWMSMQIGFAVANIFNPQFGELMGPLTVFYEMFTIALFFSLDLHLSLIEIMVKTFQSPAKFSFAGNVIELSYLLFPLALKLSAPVLLVQVLMNIGLGFLSRIMPQANVFFVGFPLLLATGIAVMWLSVPIFTMVLSRAFINLKDSLLILLR